MLVLDGKSKINGKLNKRLFKRCLLLAFKGPPLSRLDKQHQARTSADISQLIGNVSSGGQAAPSPHGLREFEPIRMIDGGFRGGEAVVW